MSIKKEESGKRSVEVQLEVPGTPEEVWQAIATTSGISSWFVPTRFEGPEDQPTAVILDFSLGMEVRGKVTNWQPLKEWTSQSDGWTPQSPPIATQWIVEARDGGKCQIRIVYSHFASSDNWDHELEGAKEGLSGFIRTLLVYLKYYRGHRGVMKQLLTSFAGSESEAWETLVTALGIRGRSVGQRCVATDGVPAFGGQLEYYSEVPYDALLRLDQPHAGIAAIGAFSMGQTVAGINFYFYGEGASVNFQKVRPEWEAFLRDRLPAFEAE